MRQFPSLASWGLPWGIFWASGVFLGTCKYFRKSSRNPLRSTYRLFQIAYEGNFWSLCTVTFWKKDDFLISNMPYNSWLYGTKRDLVKMNLCACTVRQARNEVRNGSSLCYSSQLRWIKKITGIRGIENCVSGGTPVLAFHQTRSCQNVSMCLYCEAS